jgi:hypothetical protein
MSYIDPRTVISPKTLIRDLEIIYDVGSTERSWAVAKFLWDNKPAVGIRWNGELGGGVSTPQSRKAGLVADIVKWLVIGSGKQKQRGRSG